MPNQQWIETPTSSYPNVEFKDEQCMESFIFVPGCTVFTGWAVLYPQNANWAWNIQVYIKFFTHNNGTLKCAPQIWWP
ncbi:MAG: hypothetical protein DCC55_35770 [Chloroflexi bacterium]|nr:MAG: hypothetical protein DCC55_35770 [Chloroflexota bacterium]